MATRTRKKSPPPLPRARLAIPGALILLAIIVAVLGYFGFATALLLGSLGAWLLVLGKHRRWKGAPEAGYVLIGVGVVILLLALFS